MTDSEIKTKEIGVKKGYRMKITDNLLSWIMFRAYLRTKKILGNKRKRFRNIGQNRELKGLRCFLEPQFGNRLLITLFFLFGVVLSS